MKEEKDKKSSKENQKEKGQSNKFSYDTVKGLKVLGKKDKK